MEKVKQVYAYLAERNGRQRGCWISVADVRGALGLDWTDAEEACRDLGDQGLAEFMGGFPLQPTTGHFTLVRLTDKGLDQATCEPRQA